MLSFLTLGAFSGHDRWCTSPGVGSVAIARSRRRKPDVAMTFHSGSSSVVRGSSWVDISKLGGFVWWHSFLDLFYRFLSV